MNGWAYYPSGEPQNVEALKIEEVPQPSISSIVPNEIKEGVTGAFTVSGQGLYLPANVKIDNSKTIPASGDAGDPTFVQFTLVSAAFLLKTALHQVSM